MQILGVILFIKLQNDTLRLNSEKQSKMRWTANPLIFWGGELCLVLGRLLV